MTGVPAPTLRAWERRYGIPSPERTESSYRLYSDADVELIERLRSLCDDGMAPAEAARLIHQSQTDSGAIPDADPFAAAREAIHAAVAEFDPRAIERAVRRAMFLGDASVVFEQIVGPSLRTIGERWHAGELSVAQEHFASEVLGNAAREMLHLVSHGDSERSALLACFPDEEHALALYGVAFHLVQWGFRPIVLGARTPPEGLADAVAKLDPTLVGLSATVTPSRSRLGTMAADYAAAVGGRPWIVGGSGSEALRAPFEDVGALVVGRQEMSEVKPAIEALIARRRRKKRS